MPNTVEHIYNRSIFNTIILSRFIFLICIFFSHCIQFFYNEYSSEDQILFFVLFKKYPQAHNHCFKSSIQKSSPLRVWISIFKFKKLALFLAPNILFFLIKFRVFSAKKSLNTSLNNKLSTAVLTKII